MTNNPVSVRTIIHFGLPQGVRLSAGLEPLWGGVVGGDLIEPNGVAALVEVKKGDKLSIFFADGNVGKVDVVDLRTFDSSKPMILQPQDALGERLDEVTIQLRLARSNPDVSAGVKAEDFWLHQMASMLLMTRKFPALRQKVIRAVENHLNGHGVRTRVREHFQRVLKDLGDRTIYGWLQNEIEEGSKKPGLTVKELKRKIWEQHQLIDDAIAGALAWDSVAASYRSSSERGELGFSAQKRFCTNCPPLSGLSVEIGNLPVAHIEQTHGPSPLKNETMDRGEAERRRRKNREERHAQQPSRGKVGSKPNPGLEARMRREGKK